MYERTLGSVARWMIVVAVSTLLTTGLVLTIKNETSSTGLTTSATSSTSTTTSPVVASSNPLPPEPLSDLELGIAWATIEAEHNHRMEHERAARTRMSLARASAASKAPVSTKTRSAPRTASTPSSGGSDVWARLAQCESGGTNANTGNGYYGYFQFHPRTWRSVGMSGLPTDHDYGTQLAAAQRLQARSGWGQWPACSRKLGLR